MPFLLQARPSLPCVHDQDSSRAVPLDDEPCRRPPPPSSVGMASWQARKSTGHGVPRPSCSSTSSLISLHRQLHDIVVLSTPRALGQRPPLGYSCRSRPQPACISLCPSFHSRGIASPRVAQGHVCFTPPVLCSTGLSEVICFAGRCSTPSFH